MSMQHEVPGLFARYNRRIKERIADFNDPHPRNGAACSPSFSAPSCSCWWPPGAA